MLWVYIGLLVVLGVVVVAGQVAYQRTLGRPETSGAKAAFVVRSLNTALVVLAVSGAVIYVLVKG